MDFQRLYRPLQGLPLVWHVRAVYPIRACARKDNPAGDEKCKSTACGNATLRTWVELIYPLVQWLRLDWVIEQPATQLCCT